MARNARTPLTELQPRRIALIKPSSLGDIIHGLPVLTALRRRFPKSHITWVVNRTYESLLRGHADLDQVIAFERHASRSGLWRSTLGFAGLLRRLRQERFDLVIDLQGLLRTGIMSQATGSCRRVGLSCAREGAAWFYSDIVPVKNFPELHAVERNWLVAEALGAGDGEKCFRLHVEESARRWVQVELHGCPRPWLAVAPGARWRTKRWPPQHFAALVSQAQREFGGTALFVGSGDDVPLSEAAGRLLAGNPRIFAGRTSLPQLVALLSEADVMLANDTGPLHLAAALGRPVVAPYTCTQVRRTGPYGQAAATAEAAVWCQGSYRKRCRRLECLDALKPDRLWPILHEILHRWESRCLSA